MTAYYNEIDPYAAQWLRNLIDAGHIAPGVVDERSIEDVYPSDLRGFTQCHFFAGIGVWSYALRSAGWADDRPLWTGSCPCQPFSSAGKGVGFADERHLWPAFHHLIEQCRPPVVIGEQVASKDAGPWIDLVQDDLEALGYAFGAVPFPAASVGAPHIRDRLYWVANAAGARPLPSALCRIHRSEEGSGARDGEPERHSAACGLGDPEGGGRARGTLRTEPGMSSDRIAEAGFVGGLADLPSSGRREECADAGRSTVRDCAQGQPTGLGNGSRDQRTGPVNGHWRDADWLLCRDERWRPVEPGAQPLAHGSAARVGRLRAYGNALVAPQAKAFIQAVMEPA